MRFFTIPVRLLISIFLLPLLMATECHDYHQPPYVRYRSAVQVRPVKKDYQAGDTIWFSYDNPDHLFSREDNGRRFSLDSLNFPVSLATDAQFSANRDPDGGFCRYISDSGTYLYPNVNGFTSRLDLTEGCAGEVHYRFRTGVILEKPGLYLLQIAGGYFGNCPDRTLQIMNAELRFSLDVPDLNQDIYLAVTDSVRKISGDIYAGAFDEKSVFAAMVQ